jgi:hypothetical protein
LTLTIIPKNTAQSISGSVNSSGSHTVLVADPALAYTCPAGKKATVRVTTLIQSLLTNENLRYRVAGELQMQVGTGVTISNPPVYFDLGVFNIDAGDTVTCTTSNTGTEGGVIFLNANVLSEIPE